MPANSTSIKLPDVSGLVSENNSALGLKAPPGGVTYELGQALRGTGLCETLKLGDKKAAAAISFLSAPSCGRAC